MKKGVVLFFSVLMFFQGLHAEIDWDSPVAISTTANPLASPQVAIDQGGNATAVWLEGGVVRAATKDFGGGWGSPVDLSGSGASSPLVVADLSGNVTAVWVEGGFVTTKTKPSAGDWDLTSSVLSQTGASLPQMKIDSSGNIALVWVRDQFIESAIKPFEDSWNVESVSLVTGNYPQIALGDNGRVVAVWQVVDGGIFKIVSSTKSSLGGSWDTEVDVSNTEINSIRPQVGVDANGNAVAVWFTYNYDSEMNQYRDVIVQSATLPNGGSWSTISSLLDDENVYNPFNLLLKLKVDVNGNAIALWMSSPTGNNFNLNSMIKPLNTNEWINPTSLVVQNKFLLSGDISVTDIADVFQVLMYYDGVDIFIVAADSNIGNNQGGGWQNVAVISDGSVNAFPMIAAVRNGNNNYLATVWLQNDTGTYSVKSAVGTGIIDLPPDNLAVVQVANDSGIFVTYDNQLEWEASSDLNVYAYNLFRNGLLIGVTLATDPLVFIDNNQLLNETVTYGVSAIMNNGAQSETIYYTIFP